MAYQERGSGPPQFDINSSQSKIQRGRMVRDLGQIRLVREVERISQRHQKPTTKMISLLNLTILGTD
jgi:hypothetical protein